MDLHAVWLHRFGDIIMKTEFYTGACQLKTKE